MKTYTSPLLKAGTNTLIMCAAINQSAAVMQALRKHSTKHDNLGKNITFLTPTEGMLHNATQPDHFYEDTN